MGGGSPSGIAPWKDAQVAAAGVMAGVLLSGYGAEAPAMAALTPPDELRACNVEELDKFADTRAGNANLASGAMKEALVDVSKCDFSNLDLSGKILSATILDGASFRNTKLQGIEMQKAQAQDVDFRDADFRDSNIYTSKFNGSDLTGANFENTILTGSTFGKGPSGDWAILKGTNFEEALLGDSDVKNACQNPTRRGLASDTLGCR
jgi:uncharacterized protein YjbI with pentapeptide repeats